MSFYRIKNHPILDSVIGACMAGPLFTGTIRPASGDTATPPPTPPSKFCRAFVFTFAAVLAGALAYSIVTAILH